MPLSATANGGLLDPTYYSYIPPVYNQASSVKGLKILVAGYYLISYSLGIKNEDGGRADVMWLIRSYANNSMMSNLGSSFVYAPNDSTVNFNIATSTFLAHFDANDVYNLQILCRDSVTTGWAANFSGLDYLGSGGVMLEYKGT